MHSSGCNMQNLSIRLRNLASQSGRYQEVICAFDMFLPKIHRIYSKRFFYDCVKKIVVCAVFCLAKKRNLLNSVIDGLKGQLKELELEKVSNAGLAIYRFKRREKG